jgi:hypothetical protein
VEAVTTRLRQRIQEAPAPEPEAKPLVPVTVGTLEPSPVSSPVAPFQASQPSLFAAPLPRSGKPKPSYQQRVSREEQAKAAGQLSLF